MNWEASLVAGGSPGAPNSVSQPGVNQRPLARFTALAQPGANPDRVHYLLDASGSSDPDGVIVRHDWDLGDGESGMGAQVAHTYAVGQTYTVKLTVIEMAVSLDSGRYFQGRLNVKRAATVAVARGEGGLPTVGPTFGRPSVLKGLPENLDCYSLCIVRAAGETPSNSSRHPTRGGTLTASTRLTFL